MEEVRRKGKEIWKAGRTLLISYQYNHEGPRFGEERKNSIEFYASYKILTSECQAHT